MMAEDKKMKIYKIEIGGDRIYVWFYSNIPEGYCRIGDKIQLREDGNITVEGLIKHIDGNKLEIARNLANNTRASRNQAARIWQKIKELFTKKKKGAKDV